MKRLPWGHKSKRCIYCGKVGPRTIVAGGYAHKRCIPVVTRDKAQLTMGDIGNAIEAVGDAITLARADIRSNLPPGSKSKAARKSWSDEERDNYDDWTDRLKRYKALRKKLLAIERAA